MCADGLPSVLAQVVNGVEKHALFLSSSVSPAEQKYS